MGAAGLLARLWFNVGAAAELVLVIRSASIAELVFSQRIVVVGLVAVALTELDAFKASCCKLQTPDHVAMLEDGSVSSSANLSTFLATGHAIMRHASLARHQQ